MMREKRGWFRNDDGMLEHKGMTWQRDMLTYLILLIKEEEEEEISFPRRR